MRAHPNPGAKRTRTAPPARLLAFAVLVGGLCAALIYPVLAPVPSVGTSARSERALVWCLGKRSKAERLAYWRERTRLDPSLLPQMGGPVTLTYTRDIAPILFEHCARCHRPGEIAPFSVLTYADVKPWTWLIGVVTASRYMPPWPPGAAGDVAFLGERKLNEEQIDLIDRWVAEGGAQGDPADLPAIPDFPEGWQLGEPDIVLALPEAYWLPPEGTDVYRNFVLPVPVETKRWVRAVEIRPGSKRVVHHGIMQVDHLQAGRRLDAEDPKPGFGGMDMGPAENPGGHLIGWSPGKIAQPVPEGMQWAVTRGSDLILQLHMLPSDEPDAIDPKIGLFLTDEPARYQPFSLVLRNNEIDIPPGEKSYVVEESVTLPVEVDVLGTYPHAHYVGKEIRAWATLPSSEEITLIHIKDWDFGWQDEYRYAEPLRLPAGTEISMRFVFDNSSENPRNPSHPPQRVLAGNRSTDEMAIIVFQVLPRREGDEAILREAVMRARLKKNPDSWLVHNLLGIALRAQGKNDEALQHFSEALRLNPDYPGISFNIANALQAKGDLSFAIEYYERVLRAEPHHPKVHNNLAIAYQAIGRSDLAVRHYREQLTLSPLDPNVHFNLGIALSALGNESEAAHHFSRAVELDAELHPARLALADALRKIGQRERAAEIYKELIARQVLSGRAHFGLGVLSLESAQVDDAMERFEIALTTDETLLDDLNNLAWSYATDPERQNPGQAVLVAELIDRTSGHRVPAILDTLAAAYAAQGRYALAVETLTHALTAIKDENDPLASGFEARLDLYRQGRPYLASGEAETRGGS